jgi:hypothetical protein
MLIIGEKLSIIAKKVREAMIKRDKIPVQEIATSQWKAGAGMIDANIGPDEVGGEDLMQWMVTTIQEVVPLPVCLDTTNYKAIRRGLRHTNRGAAADQFHADVPRGSGCLNSQQNIVLRLSVLQWGKGDCLRMPRNGHLLQQR